MRAVLLLILLGLLGWVFYRETQQGMGLRGLSSGGFEIPIPMPGRTFKFGGKLPSDVNALIEKYAAQYGVDPELAKAQAYAESRGNQNAVSPAGALGVFQLMPATAKWLGVDATDVQQNVEGGIRYLASLLKRYNGDENLALAAYNAGPGNVHKFGGVPPFTETKNYIARIYGSLIGDNNA